MKGRDAIIVDDMVDTAGTLCAAAQAVKAQGARAVYACASHGVLSPPAVERIMASPLEELLITDTMPVRARGPRLLEDQGPPRRAPARRGGQAHSPRRLDQLAVHLKPRHRRTARKTQRKQSWNSQRSTSRSGPGTGKGGSRKVRAAGKVPGVLYGRKLEPITVTFDEKELLTSLDKEKRRNTVLTLSITGGGKTEKVTAMVRDAQINPLSRRLVHVDFLRVDLDAEVHVTVPLVLTGKAIGTTNGGKLHQSMHVIPVAAKPAAIPTKLEVDVTRARHRRRAPRQRPQAGRGRARAARSDATPSRRSSRRRPRRSRGRGGPRRGRGPGRGRGWRCRRGWRGGRQGAAAPAAGQSGGGKEEKKGEEEAGK